VLDPEVISVAQDAVNLNSSSTLAQMVSGHAGRQLHGLNARPMELVDAGPEDPANVKRKRFKAGIAEVEPLCLGADEVAALLGIGKTLLYELDSTGKIPPPLKLGNRCVWAIAELRSWVAAGCPDRQRWQTLRRSRQ
jgi:prophage regulatory protein